MLSPWPYWSPQLKLGISGMLASCCAGLITCIPQATFGAAPAAAVVERDAAAWYALGLTRQGNLDYPGALEAFTRATEMDGSNPRYWKGLGEFQAAAGNHAAAADAYRKMIALNADNPWGYQRLGTALGALGKKDEAIQAFEEAVFLGQDDSWFTSIVDSYNDYRRTIGLANATVAAIIENRNDRVRKSATAAPQQQASLDELIADARRLALAGKHEEAARRYRDALVLAPARADLHAAVAGELVGINKSSHDEQATIEIREAVRLDPTVASSHQLLCYLLAVQFKYPEAVAACSEAVRLEPSAAHWIALGDAQFGAGDLDAGIQSYRKANALDPDNAQRHADLAQRLKEAGRPQEALLEYQRALEIRPEAAAWRSSYDQLRVAAGQSAALSATEQKDAPAQAAAALPSSNATAVTGAPVVESQCTRDLEKQHGYLKQINASVAEYSRKQRDYARARNLGQVCFYWKLTVDTLESAELAFQAMAEIYARCLGPGPDRSRYIASANFDSAKLRSDVADARDRIREQCSRY